MQSLRIASAFIALAAASVAYGQSQQATQASPSKGATNHLTPSETKFVEETLKGGRSEVEMAKIALAQGADSQVKSFAQRLVNDHTAANTKLERIAAANKLSSDLNSESAEARKDTRTNSAVVGQPVDTHLAGLKGPEFDKAFVKMMVENHQSGIAKYEAMEKEASNPDLKAYVSSTLPTLREHLKQAQSLAK
jgi:putative membrane protein